MRIISAVGFKRRIAGDCIFGIVIYKLGYWQELCLIILFKDREKSEIDLHCTILALYLTIDLRLKRSRELLLDIEKVAV